MKIILLENIINLGKIGNIVNVKPGYARNFLIPKKKSIFYTKNKLDIENKKILNNNILNNKYDLNYYKEIVNKIIKLENIIFYKKSNSKGKLFDSVNSKMIISYIENKFNIINKNFIKTNLIKKIKNIGNFYIRIIVKNNFQKKILIIIK